MDCADVNLQILLATDAVIVANCCMACSPCRRKTANTLIEKRAGQRKPQGERKRQRSKQPGVTDIPDHPSASEATESDTKLSPAEKRAAMEARIAEKKRKKAEREKNREL